MNQANNPEHGIAAGPPPPGDDVCAPGQAPTLMGNRWFQLSTGILSLVAVANFQYAFTFFTIPLERAHGWTQESIQVAFTLFVLAQTWLVPVEAYLAERFGPRLLLVGGGSLATAGWIINAFTDSLPVFYLAQVFSGCGAGIVYGLSMGSALKWFTDRRGLAAGLTAAAFGAGSAATVIPIMNTIASEGYQAAFIWFGLGQGLVVVLAGLFMRFPEAHEVPPAPDIKVLQTTRDYAPAEVVRAPSFWLLYVMMTVGAIPGLLILAQVAVIARDFQVAALPVIVFGIVLAERALPLATMVDRIMGGFTRPAFGWISDRIGREVAMFVAFSLEGGALLLLICYPHDPVVFVLMSGLAFFGWGAVFSLFPAVVGDMFGRKYAATNYAMLYTAKGAASILILGCNRLQAETESWVPVFVLLVLFDWLAAILALAVLRPLRRRTEV
jgi:MFS transporter, OFA family, oxalate/formate antiporter